MKLKKLFWSVLLPLAFFAAFIAVALSNADLAEETKYYTTLQAAISDAAEKTTAGADTGMQGAIAALKIYKSGRYEVILLKDTELDGECRISNASFTLNLNGRILTTSGIGLIIDGGEMLILGHGGSIINITDGELGCALRIDANSETKLTVSDLNVFSSANKVCLGIAFTKTAAADITLNDCNVTAVNTGADGGTSTSAVFTNSNTNINLTINGGTYIGDAKYRLIRQDTEAAVACGIKIQQKGGAIRLNGIKAIGIHSGISTLADMELINSYCASPTHGGLYNGGLLYAEGTTFECSSYTGECRNTAEIKKARNLGAMYNGSTKRCAVAYLNNCTFINGDAPYGLVISTNYGYLSPTAYISNCKIENLRVDGVREDNPNTVGTVYIGKNVIYNLRYGTGIIDKETYAGKEFLQKQ